LFVAKRYHFYQPTGTLLDTYLNDTDVAEPNDNDVDGVVGVEDDENTMFQVVPVETEETEEKKKNVGGRPVSAKDTTVITRGRNFYEPWSEEEVRNCDVRTVVEDIMYVYYLLFIIYYLLFIICYLLFDSIISQLLMSNGMRV
jgi:hypothetical protein